MTNGLRFSLPKRFVLETCINFIIYYPHVYQQFQSKFCKSSLLIGLRSIFLLEISLFSNQYVHKHTIDTIVLY